MDQPSSVIVSDVWYALQTGYCRESLVSSYLDSCGIRCFIPRRWCDEKLPGGQGFRRVLRPAVHNLLFFQSTCPEPDLRHVLETCPWPVSVYRHRDTGRWCAISGMEMSRLRAASDPSYTGTLFVSADEARLRRGALVRVFRGPLKGLEGRLVRYRNRYYVVLVTASLGVMVHVPRWYCRPLCGDGGTEPDKNVP